MKGMLTNLVICCSITVLSILMIAFNVYHIEGLKKSNSTCITISEIPFFNDFYAITNPTRSLSKRIIFSAHYLSKMIGASKTSEFSMVAKNWSNWLNKEAKSLTENDRTVATSILSIMRSYEDMKSLRSMGFTHAKYFWSVITTLMEIKMIEGYLTSNSLGIFSNAAKKTEDA